MPRSLPAGRRAGWLLALAWLWLAAGFGFRLAFGISAGFGFRGLGWLGLRISVGFGFWLSFSRILVGFGLIWFDYGWTLRFAGLLKVPIH